METLIEKFKIWLRANGKAVRTIEQYEINIKIFIKENNISSVEQITRDVVNAYVARLKDEKKYAISTCNQHIATIASFMDFNDVAIRLPKCGKPEHKIVKILEEEDLEKKILPMIEREFEDFLRVKAIIMFLYYVGMRKGDVTKVKREQFNLDKNYVLIKIEKQNNKEKKMVIPNTLKNVLFKYFASEPEVTSAFNLVNRQIDTIFAKLRWMFPELELHPHKFRKSFATNAKRLGLHLEDIQNLLGHGDIQTTKKYVEDDDEDEIRERYLLLEEKKLKRKG
jgi:integrase/recombinase XerD